ncbi:MAG: hypothetical protein CVU56_27255 [Deltaproteobacteria bacterium HGW-Deltaproteobacteria-14]|jgi:arginine deiminase|nr:MAG: hypothetical protein CVU56_27255 [Deltaproteobacteria bacterium HGW-Deltaproteobacteria-14]
MRIAVHSEIAPLELIVTSPPGPEFDFMLPENLEAYRPDAEGRLGPSPDYLLFDDLVLLSAMQSEHAQLVEVVRAVTGQRGHFTWRQLLVETLGEPEVRREVIHRTLELEDRLYPHRAAERDALRGALEDLDAPRLAEALILGRHPADRRPLFRWPAPNALFSRDLMAVVGDAVVMTYAAEPARGREMLLSRMILRHHHAFRGVPHVDIGEDAHGIAGLSIEGGDVQVLDDETVLVGVGIRTTMAAVDKLAPLLFARGVETVLCYEMPRRRAAMHIDTLFTRIDESHCLIYPPLVENPQALGARVHRITAAEGRVDAGAALLPVLAYHGINLHPVYCGGSNPIMQAREQWSDGANAFALAPGVIVCYGRNRHTLRQLNRIGYEVVSSEQFVDNALYYVSQGRKIVVALMGHELVRGRGGPRCLTLPLRRRAIDA